MVVGGDGFGRGKVVVDAVHVADVLARLSAHAFDDGLLHLLEVERRAVHVDSCDPLSIQAHAQAIRDPLLTSRSQEFNWSNKNVLYEVQGAEKVEVLFTTELPPEVEDGQIPNVFTQKTTNRILSK